MIRKDIKLLYVDLFCGAGGTSTGVETARLNGRQCAMVIACVNHDKNAIASHAENHPEALHFTEDIRTLELTSLMLHVETMRSEYPNAKVALWASLECTNFSKAKGGLPRDADSRTLADHLHRYIDAIDPDYIQIENVEEFMSWGKLDENGKPISRLAGTDYVRWVNEIIDCGYRFDHRILNAADFGAYTSRRRFFGQFAKHDLPVAWPEKTHDKESGELLGLKRWNPVREKLDLDDEGESIFTRKRPLVENTLARIYAGLIKFVAGGHDCFLQQRNGGNPSSKVTSINSPARVITCTGGNLEKVNVSFLSKYHGGTPRTHDVNEPCRTVDTSNRFALVNTSFLSKAFSGHPDSKNISIDGPAHTVTTTDHHHVVNAKFLSTYYGNGGIRGLDEPAATVTTKDRLALVNTQFIEMKYGNGFTTSVDDPASTVTCNPKHNLVSCVPWIMNTNFSNIGASVEDPCQVITANRKWHYLMNPQFASAGGSVDNPCFTLIARMDKMPPYLISTECGKLAIQVFDIDSPMTQKIKEFMAMYGIVDIKMRMLKIQELKEIMGFPKDYTLIGTQAEQKKYIGNAVEVNTSRALCLALATKLDESFCNSGKLEAIA